MASARKSKQITKDKADYESNGIKKDFCDECKMFVEPDHCTLVLGFIRRKGHCKYFERKNGLLTT